MGIILSRVRKKKSTIETLEKLESEIKEIEENRSDAQRKYKKITKLFLIYSTGLYILCGIFFYYYFTSTYKEKLLYLVPLALSPLILYIVKRIISWYYIRLINKNQKRLNEMKKEKNKILDEVMEKETYKVAKEILEKYSSDSLIKVKQMQLAQVNPISNDSLRKRVNAPKVQGPSNILNSLTADQTPRPISHVPRKSLPAQSPPKLWMPAPILPLNRTYMDKFVEYLIGDGPNNRYALICSRCHSHNGMALKEEFEYIGYKCCYCYQYNPARKIKPEAPKLENFNRSNYKSDSDSDSKSSSESSDNEIKSILNSEELKSIKNQEETFNAEVDATKIKSFNPETDKTNKIGEKVADSTAEGDIRKFEKTPQENFVEEPSSSNQADDTYCDQSLLKS